MSTDNLLYRRQFLNSEEHGGTAFVEATVYVSTHRATRGEFSASLKVADCSRMVTLDFDVYGDSDADNVRQKLQRFGRSWRAFEQAVLEQLDARDKAAKRAPVKA